MGMTYWLEKAEAEMRELVRSGAACAGLLGGFGLFRRDAALVENEAVEVKRVLAFANLA
jgi:hypothetical protein